MQMLISARQRAFRQRTGEGLFDIVDLSMLDWLLATVVASPGQPAAIIAWRPAGVLDQGLDSISHNGTLSSTIRSIGISSERSSEVMS